jgi:hypothetical protein
LILGCADGHDLKRAIRQRTLQLQRKLRRLRQPLLNLFAGRVWALWLAGRLAFQAEFLFIAFAEFFQN